VPCLLDSGSISRQQQQAGSTAGQRCSPVAGARPCSQMAPLPPQLLPWVLLLAGSGAAGVGAAAADAATLRPHVLLMLADDLGNYEVGFHNPRAITPNIDALAEDGVVLERHYVYHCCGPTRAATMTGRLPYHGNQHNVNDLNSTAGADLRMTFLPAKLKQAGYATSMIGKSHLGARSTAHLPINRGFDQHFGFLGGGEDHFTQVSAEDPVVGDLVDLWRDHGPAFGENGTFSGFLYSREAERVIAQHAAERGPDVPLFMYLAWHLVSLKRLLDESPWLQFTSECQWF
jgi:arylsulfatase B